MEDAAAMTATTARESIAITARRTTRPEPRVFWSRPAIARPPCPALVTCCIVLVVTAAPLRAQQDAADIIRGRVADDSGHAIAAAVTVTRGPDRLVRQANADSAGRYELRFEQGTGDYLVHVAAPGFVTARRRVQRQGSERELLANFTLARDVATLSAVKVVATRPVRATTVVGPTRLETGAAERWSEGVAGQLPPTVAGDLGALAATLPNVTMTSAGPAILGGGGESSLTTLNGVGIAADALPRAARTETRVTGATFDATRGGFSSANVDVRLGPGDRNFQRRNGFITLDPPGMQVTDAVGRVMGAPTGGVRVSMGADGELIRQALTYNVGVDVARRTSRPATLTSADADALRLAGLAPDSAARLVALARAAGVPLGGAIVPEHREHLALTWLGRFDDTRDSLGTRTLITYASVTRDGAVGFGPLAAPSTAGDRRMHAVGAQLVVGSYVGPGRRVLTETRLSASATRSIVAPYLGAPTASVLVPSATDSSRDVTAVTLGGASFRSGDDATWTAEGANETAWNAGGDRHRFKSLLWGRADGLRQSGSANPLGTFTFNSLADFAAGRPASFVRTLGVTSGDGRVWNAAGALADQYAPTRFFSLLYGARLEADGFAGAPPRNPELERALGVRTGAAPWRLHLSPRIGFTYTYNPERNAGTAITLNQVGRFFRAPTGTIRGGIGEFRDLLRPGLLAGASAAAGLPDGASVLSCVGSAAPAPHWPAFGADPAAVPAQCLDSSGVLGERAPAVRLIDPSYDVPRSWRTSLDWTTTVGTWLLRVGGLASYDLAQPGTVDANFTGTPRFTLAGEGNRPVFVSPTAIDPASGTASAAGARRSALFGPVTQRVSDLRGYGGQLTVGLSPDVFKLQSGRSAFLSTGYTLQWVRRQYRGFDGAGFGDPREQEWAPSAGDARHIVVVTGGYASAAAGVVTLFARAQSGLPFTPVVQGDVNGDGRPGDRAFIPRPSEAASADPGLAAQLEALLAGGAPAARRCLLANLGRAPGRNACRGPWTQSLNVQWRPPMPRRWGSRAIPSVYLQNVLAGVDQLLHGSGALHGWGSPVTPDSVLLVARGFDAATQRFRYAVNPRFADTRPGGTSYREPFRVVLDVALALSTNIDLQRLRRASEPVRGPQGWQLRSADSLTAFYLRSTSSIHKLLLEESDSLLLTRPQAAALRQADSAFSTRVRALYRPLGDYLEGAHGRIGTTELDSVRTTQRRYWEIFWEQPEIAAAILTRMQRELVPLLTTLVDTPMHERERSTWQFQRAVTFVDRPRGATP
jgi:hypothetical protein